MEREIELEGVKNARELGGIKTLDGHYVKKGLLIRCGRLENITEAGKAELKRLNVTRIIDFRSYFEIKDHPDPGFDGIRNDIIPLLDPESEAGKGAGQLIAGNKVDKYTFVRAYEKGFSMYPVYKSFTEEPFSVAALRQAFEILISGPADEAVLWHCNGGKDRTGFFSVMLLAVLGVEDTTMADDFELSNTGCREQIELERKIASEYTDDPELIRKVGYIAGVDREHMETVIAGLNETYGSVAEFVRQKIGVTAEETKILKDKYLE